MNLLSIGIIICGVLLVSLCVFVLYRRIPKKLKVEKYLGDWKQLQSYCKDKAKWPDAILEADKLLDHALKRRKFKGKSMGERMVSAQRVINNNDQLWFAHNLAKKLVADPAIKLKESDVKAALIGFRQALKDLGAIQTPDTTTSQDTKEAIK